MINDQISNEYKQYLCFSAYFSTNTLVFGRNEHLWSDEQQKTHDNIKSLHNSGMGYRRIYIIYIFLSKHVLTIFARTSISFTVTELPDCLYNCPFDESFGSLKLFGNPCNEKHSFGVSLRIP